MNYPDFLAANASWLDKAWCRLFKHRWHDSVWRPPERYCLRCGVRP